MSRVGLLKLEVSITYPQWTGCWAGREGPGHTHSTTILCLRDAHYKPGVDWPPEARKQSHKNHTASTWLKSTQLLHSHTTPLTQKLTSFPVCVGQLHLLTTMPTPPFRCLSHRCQPSVTVKRYPRHQITCEMVPRGVAFPHYEYLLQLSPVK